MHIQWANQTHSNSTSCHATTIPVTANCMLGLHKHTIILRYFSQVFGGVSSNRLCAAQPHNWGKNSPVVIIRSCYKKTNAEH